MAGLKRDVDQIVRQARRSGCDISTTSRGHWKVTKPGHQTVIISPQPTNRHAVRNARADLKRYLSVEV